jgi:hypothetical protein
VTIAEQVDWYVRHVLRVGDRSGRVDAPADVVPLSTRDVGDALTDPTILFHGLDIPAVQDRMDRLMRFALWLEHADGDWISSEFASRAARYRFLLWSLPARFPPGRYDKVYPQAVGWKQRTPLSIDQVRERARAARADWMGYLAAAEDDLWLSALQANGDPLVERDLRWLALAWPKPRPGPHGTGADALPTPSAPLDLSDSRSPEKLRRSQHRAVVADLAEVHWLPRGSILQATATFGWRPLQRFPALAAFPLSCVAVLALVLTGHGDLARWAALVVLGAAGLTVALLPARVDTIALLRIPAAAGAGQALLLSLTPRWWLSPNGWLIGAAMLAAVSLYVHIEARLHGVERWFAAGRAVLITLFGALCSFVLSVVFLGFVVPAMGEDGGCLAGWWNAGPLEPFSLNDTCHHDHGQPAAAWPFGILVLMTGWSLAVGTAAQILWDDRPLTAPLGRLRRVRGTRP